MLCVYIQMFKCRCDCEIPDISIKVEMSIGGPGSARHILISRGANASHGVANLGTGGKDARLIG